MLPNTDKMLPCNLDCAHGTGSTDYIVYLVIWIVSTVLEVQITVYLVIRIVSTVLEIQITVYLVIQIVSTVLEVQITLSTYGEHLCNLVILNLNENCVRYKLDSKVM